MKLARRLRSGKYTLQPSLSDYQHTKIIFLTFAPRLTFPIWIIAYILKADFLDVHIVQIILNFHQKYRPSMQFHCLQG